MAIRDKLRKGSEPFLQEGEEVQAAWLAKRPSIRYNDRAIVATNRRLMLLELNFSGRPTALLAEAERGTRLGPCSGFMYPINAFGEQLVINRRFFKDVADADRLVSI